jgi:hypothetical protein
MPNNLYAAVVNGELKTDSALFTNYKPLVYAKVPAFNQETQYVVQSKFVDEKDRVFLGVEVKTVIADIKPMDMVGNAEIVDNN